MALHKVLFLPSRKTGHFETGTNLRDAALELGIVIESSCAGIGTCGKCKVQVHEGVSALTLVEEDVLTGPERSQGFRLSCQAEISGLCVCVVPEGSQTFGDQIMAEGRKGRYLLNPDVRKLMVRLPEPKLSDKYFDFDQLREALWGQGVQISNYDLETVRTLSRVLRDSQFTVTAVIDGTSLLAVEPGDTTESLFGVAVDIGTTTIAAKLLNMRTGETCAVATALNPQRSYGADVISRIRHIIEHPGGLELMHRLIAGEINRMIGVMCEETAVPRGQVMRIVAVGNTVMQHFLLNLDPRNVAFKPYVPAFQGPAMVLSRDLGISIHDRGTVYVLPNLASFVGADITAVLTVLDMDEADEIHLAVDIGTNGEMVLGSKSRMLCASSPAGPAWEGAYITWGMRAARGAIERAEIFDGDLQVRTIGNVDPVGICGSGLLDLVSEFLREGVIDASGRILGPTAVPAHVSPKLRERIIVHENGLNDIAVARIDAERAILLTQKDVREVQLAKGAIATGIRMLMKELNVETEQIASVSIAGAFGNHVRGKDAVDCGLLPPVPVDRVRFIGNAALAGAEAVLLSREAREKAERLSREVGYVEISEKADFQDVFVESMLFPGRS